MTVKELREMLQKAPDDAEVWAGSESDQRKENGAYGTYTPDLFISYGYFEKGSRLLIGGISGNVNPIFLAGIYRTHLLTKMVSSAGTDETNMKIDSEAVAKNVTDYLHEATHHSV